MEKVHYIKQTNGKRNLFYYPDIDEVKISSIPGKKMHRRRYNVPDGVEGVLTLSGLLLMILVFAFLIKYDYYMENYFIFCRNVIVLSVLCGLIYKKIYSKQIDKIIAKENPEKCSIKKVTKLYMKSLINELIVQMLIVVFMLSICLWVVFNTDSFCMATMCGVCIVFLGPIIVAIDFVGKAKLICRLKKEK